MDMMAVIIIINVFAMAKKNLYSCQQAYKISVNSSLLLATHPLAMLIKTHTNTAFKVLNVGK